MVGREYECGVHVWECECSCACVCHIYVFVWVSCICVCLCLHWDVQICVYICAPVYLSGLCCMSMWVWCLCLCVCISVFYMYSQVHIYVQVFCWSIYLCVHLCKPKDSDRCLPQLSFPLFKGSVFINLSSQVRLELSTCQPTYRIHLSSPNIMVTVCIVLPNIFSGCQWLFWGYCFIYQSLYKLTHLLRPVKMSLLK